MGSTGMIKVKTVDTPANRAKVVELRKALLKEIGAKWRKFSETELAGFSTKDDLVSKVAALYELEKPQALKDVDALLNGRRL